MRKKAIILFFGTWLATIIGLWGCIDLLHYLGFHLLQDRGAVGLVVIGFSGLIVAIMVLIINGELVLREEGFEPGTEKDYDGKKLSKAIITELEKLRSDQDYQTILRIGRPLSRTLWLEGQYKTRVEVGKAVEAAAGALGDKKAQCQALIDDIGWTLVVLGKDAEAEKFIQRGITIAQNKLPEFAAKGHRHLAGISLQRKLPPDALKHLDDAANAAIGIAQQDEKDDMLGNIDYLRASAFLASGDLVAAEKFLDKAEAEFKDESRAVKIFALRGKLAERKNDPLAAKDSFREGLKEAKKQFQHGS